MSTTEALFLGGPWDNRNVSLGGNPPVFRVQTLEETHEYWAIPSGGFKQLYLHVSKEGLPKRVKYAYSIQNLENIGDATQAAILQVVEQGGDKRTVTTTTSIGGTGSRVVYTVVAEAFVVPVYKNENN